ncbi:MAG: helix-turn-helix domain-containing protein [Hyphomonadaceae bacterium]|nr:helix-turn-helix domain-containing protein [Hyphomonadaceae bacterium]
MNQPSDNWDDLLTDEDIVERYRGRITIGTLRNWRAAKKGPPYLKIGKAVLYRRDDLTAWEKRHAVRCDGSM